MNDLGIIDRFTNVFSQYIDSGFGLLGAEVAYLTATLIAIDIALAGIFWAMGGEDIVPKLLRKTLYVGVFAFIITNFSQLADILFNSFARLGLIASDSLLTAPELLRPGRLAAVGVDAGRPLMNQLGNLTGFPDIFLNLDTAAVLFLAWLIVILSFFILAVQLFVTIIEFKLTTLAGFVLVPFALWNKTAFLAERVLGNVVSSGIKILVLAVVVGVGTNLFDEMIAASDAELSIDDALATMLASLALFALGLFGPGIATGLVSGGPQLGGEVATGTALALGGAALAGATGAARAARVAGSVGGAAVSAAAAAGKGAGPALKAAGPIASAGYSSFKTGLYASGASGPAAVAAGLANVARASGQAMSRGVQSTAGRVESAIRQRLGLPTSSPPPSSSAAGSAPTSADSAADAGQSRSGAASASLAMHLKGASVLAGRSSGRGHAAPTPGPKVSVPDASESDGKGA